jgi:ribosomal protein L17
MIADYNLNEKQRKARENPLKEMTDPEILQLKRWVNSLFREKGIKTTEFGDSYVRRAVEEFLEYDGRQSVKRARDSVASALGYDTFSDLVEDWRKQVESAESLVKNTPQGSKGGTA